ncbi:hypothetical protein [Paraburkholderia diazotrophica]|uniref:Uncharacterized protein n=1 Tax=Paraburkholderia diazotrophica TaxID=667676 RepID=A0A1H7DDZ0_9BURK|nr:hypothetical protein [Paraburkholderia diazotrophica]SEJ99127.1 hypothetical protein SAMN05192539_102838 [Paraburkholderia diazotrophica]
MRISYNSLHVPLDIGTWQCTLVLAREFYSLSGGYWDAFDDWDKLRERERQIEDDRRAFERYVRPNYDFRSLMRTDIDAIRSFLRDHLNVVRWNLPADNAGIERALKQAVRDGLLVPVINREWRSLPMTFRPTPAPLRWPSASGGGGFGSSGGTVWAAFRNAGPGPLIWEGEPVLRGPYDPSTQEAQLKAARAAMAASAGCSDGGFNLLDVAEAMAVATLRGDSAEDECSDDALVENMVDSSGNTSTPLGDAQPFEPGDSADSDNVLTMAARGVSEEQEGECFAAYERDGTVQRETCPAW